MLPAKEDREGIGDREKYTSGNEDAGGAAGVGGRGIDRESREKRKISDVNGTTAQYTLPRERWSPWQHSAPAFSCKRWGLLTARVVF